MKTRIVPSAELSIKNLSASHYIPSAFYKPDKRITFMVREANNVLEEEDWAIVSITLLEERIVRLSVVRMGCAIPGFRLWDGMGQLLEWLTHDPTGVYRKAWDPVARAWRYIENMEGLIAVLSNCYRHRTGS